MPAFIPIITVDLHELFENRAITTCTLGGKPR